jgi:protein-S-isoprenylcysteine O-methyltransferase Ste14
LKGLEKLREKLPGLRGVRIALLPIGAILSFVAGLIFLLSLDTIPRLNPANAFLRDVEYLLPVLGPIANGVAGWGLVYLIWHRKDRYLAVYKESAYQRGILYGVLGIPLIMGIVIHAYLPIDQLLGISPATQIAVELSSPIITFSSGWKALEWVITVPGSLLLLLTGLATILRSLLTFGLDYMGLVYLYHPEESEVQDHGIYSVVRHPAYMGLLLIALGGFLARLSIYSLGSFLILVLGFICHLRLVEERELKQRFGPSFLDYMRKVPGLYVKPSKLPVFIKFLIGQD